MDWIIDVAGLKKNFLNKPAVVDVNLKIKPGEICAFLGPNGSGKTTTIRMLCGLLTPSGGSGYCMGYDILTESSRIKQHVGYMTQYFSLFGDLTIFENLNFISQIRGIKNHQEVVEAYMDKLNLSPRRNQLAKSLSGGWKQRLSLAATLLHKPTILLLDEPTAGIDPKARRDFWELLHHLAAEGTTVLLSTHNMEELIRCQRIVYMAYGRSLLYGTTREIKQQVQFTTWEVTGPNLPLIAQQIRLLPGVDQVNTLYDALHVIGGDAGLLEHSTEKYRKISKYKWEKIEPALDDIFLWLANTVRDERYDAK